MKTARHLGFVIASFLALASATRIYGQAPLNIICPTNQVVWTCGTSAVPVPYPAPAVSNSCRFNAQVSCVPPANTLFPLGTSTVNCTATNACGEHDSCVFTVTVIRDTAPPVIQCPSNITVSICGTNRVAVSWPPPTGSDNSGDVKVNCTPASGSLFSIGTTVVTCVATDGCTNRSSCNFSVTVKGDNTAPEIQCPPDITILTCSAGGVGVTYPRPTASDDQDSSPTVACSPPSGSIFPVGSTLVTCEAIDNCTNRARCTFRITVNRDVTPPVIECPTDMVVASCNSNTVVNFPSPTAVDDEDRSPTVICVPPSGSIFPLGDTIVHCEAVDDCTNRSTCAFTVSVVRDTVPPFIDCPSDRTNVACSAAGIAVAYSTPDASDNFDGSPTVTCVPPSGSMFPPGTNVVQCTAVDDCNNRSQCTFRIVVVRDTTPPVIHCPADIIVETCNSMGEVVSYDVTATDDHDNYVPPQCFPPVPTIFPIGISTVTCQAEDNCGNRSTCSFKVTVRGDTSLPGTDLDQNGLSDIWQIHFRTRGLLPAGDADRDGMSNAAEALAGTDPNDPLDNLKAAVSHSDPAHPNQLMLHWSGVPGKVYKVHSSPNLDGDYMDEDLPAGVVDPTTLIIFLDDPRFPERLKRQAFFRIQAKDIDEDQDGLTAWEEMIIGTSERNPDTFGTPGGDRTYAEQWIIQNGPTSAGKLREVTVAHLGGSPQGPTQTRLVTATGTGGFIQLSSWTINPATQQPIHLQDAAVLEGFRAKLHVLEPEVSPSLTINLFVFGRIREDGNLWLTVYRLAANGSFTELATVGYGANQGVSILEFAMAHRTISNTGGGGSFQLVTPVIASPEPFKQHLRLITWSVNPITGALSGIADSGDLNHGDVRGGGNAFIQIQHQSGSAYVVSYSNTGSDLSSWFFEVPNNGVILPRGGEISGLDIRGATNVVVAAQQFALGTLTPDGFLTALFGDACNLELMVWEKRVVACDGPCYSRPLIITTNTADLLPGNGIQITLPKITDSRDSTGEANEHFGKVLAVGDFNGDGYQDVAIGTPGEADGAGAVDVMYGSVDYLKGGKADHHFVQGSDGVFGAPEAGDAFGGALAVGDFDGDGFDDLAIGIPGEDLGNSKQAAGAVQILRGSIFGLVASGNNLFWTQDSPDIAGVAETGDGFGTALTTGDFNGDGYADLAIGAPFEDIEAANAIAAGAVNIIYGSVNGLDAAAGPGNIVLHQDIFSIIDEAESGDWFGRALAAGDFNGDGYADLAIGAPGESLGPLTGAGIVHILYGTASGFNIFTFMVSQDEFLPPGGDILGHANFFDFFGWSLATGDFNGDGYADLAIGNPFDEENGAPLDSGTVNVLFGSQDGIVVAGNQLLSQDDLSSAPEAGDQFGYALATADFNSDARTDLVVGVRGEGVNNNAVPGAGAAHVVFGSVGGLTTVGEKLLWQGNSISGLAETNDHFGAAVAAGDLNGDGHPDLIIAAPDDDDGDTVDAGAFHVLKGTADGPTTEGDFVWKQGVERKIRALLVDVLDEQINGVGAGNLFEQMPPNEPIVNHIASVTKVMTLLISVKLLQDAALNISLTDTVRVSQVAADTGGSHIDQPYGPVLETDDKMPLQLLMHGMMQRSCNKSSVAIAEYLAAKWYEHLHGSLPEDFNGVDYFVTNMMQQMAGVAGISQNTLYTHPAGGCISTPQDQATLWLYAIQYPLFVDFATRTTYDGVGEDADGDPKLYFLEKLGTDGPYPGLGGWKGGNGRLGPSLGLPSCTSCVIAEATRLNRDLVVSLQQSGDRWGDTKRLFDYGYKVLFTPDYRGSATLNVQNITDFAVRKITDTLSVTAAIDAQNNLRLHTWQTVAGIGQVAQLNSASLTYNALPVGTHYVATTFLDMTRLPSIEAQADYLTGRLQNGRLHLDLWRVAPNPEF